MPERFGGCTRRQWLQGCLGGALLAITADPPFAKADAKLSKAVVSYRDRPNGSKECANCAHYGPAAKAGEPGQCDIVAGPVGPHGYCIVWAARNPKGGCA